MKAIILSAGQGSRLGHLVDGRPKCLIEFSGRTLLDRQLDTLEANGVHEAVVVTGFHDELVNEAIAKRTGGPKVRTIFNPFYKVADNTGSLYMAREELSGDCLVWNGDTLVSRDLMAKVVGNDRSGICVTIDRKEGYDDDDMKVVADDDDGRLRAIGKRITEGVNAESIGLLAFRSGGAEQFRGAIEKAMRTSEGTTIWYLRVIHHLAQTGEVWTLDINGAEWGEVDFPPDVEAAQDLTARWDAAAEAVAAE
ncbi:NTP transferase domain-containing protein [Sphingomonas daechungensis]|uniref:Phosphocholine cytidylyltransferase family protein n=1 Tax=Sphingomonas daechungensis TaxID=1176646 RepID=A0ABX6T1F6_9SPHN|nr:phosphocholine cytidylyltransferase family protein [Sphingomonas daechungensis]QNP42840.1 phosphocholine cytidylyltransferase family protein [Sphingomonas daechungensis]